MEFIVKYLKQTCIACPSAWKGETTEGKEIYLRYRWGGLSIRIDDLLIYSDDNFGEGLDGWLEMDEVVRVMSSQGFIFNADSEIKDYEDLHDLEY